MESPVHVAIISDTHGHLDSRIAAAIKRCDYAVHAGDIGNAEVLAAMQPRAGIVVAVRGNNDIPGKWPETECGVLAALPGEALLQLPGGTLTIVHGDTAGAARKRHEWLRTRFPDTRAIVYGHSHHALIDQTLTPWILNPGAAGRARTFGGPSCLLLLASHQEWTVQLRRFDSPPPSHARLSKFA